MATLVAFEADLSKENPIYQVALAAVPIVTDRVASVGLPRAASAFHRVDPD